MPDLLERLKTALADRYKIEGELGHGGMATVYLAQDLKHKRKVAIKVLKPELAVAVGSERFLHEIETTAGFTHPNILPLHESGQADDILYYVMPYVEGETLRDRLNKEKQLPVEDAVSITRDVARALGYAHTRGVIHRDIKPENILLSEGVAVVADFGIARAVGGSDGLTATGVSIGTPLYMSPEQSSGQTQVDARSDLYSLGCVFFEMLAGQPPFTGATAESVINQHRSAEVPKISSIRPTTVGHLESILARLLAKAPADRFGTSEDLIKALQAETRATTVITPAKTPARKIKGLAVGVVIAAVLAITIGLNPGGLRDRLFGGAARAEIGSLAVLPLEDLSEGAQYGYFADGMTEALTAELGKIHSLLVISRTSAMRYRDTDKTISEIGRELNVDAVIEGSVLREGDRVRITAQLIHAQSDRHLWAESYIRDLSDVMTLQGEVARDIAREVRATLTPGEEAELTHARPVNPAALEAYLKGRAAADLGTMEGGHAAGQYFEQALQIDPDYPIAHLAMADFFSALGEWNLMRAERALPQAKAAARRALELDPSLVEAHARLALIHLSEWDWHSAEEEAKRALELNSNSSRAHTSYAEYLSIFGRHDEAIDQARRVLELDPLSVDSRFALGKRYLYARRFDEAIEQFRVTIEIGHGWGHYRLGETYLYKGMHELAIFEFQTHLDIQHTVEASAYLAWAYAVAGKESEARKILAEIVERSEREHVSPLSIAFIYAELGDIDAAFDWMERGYVLRDPYLRTLRVSPAYDVLRSDPRFDGFVRRVGLSDI